MALSKHLQDEIKRVQPIKGSEPDRWRQYDATIQVLEPVAVKEALDELHRAVARQLKL